VPGSCIIGRASVVDLCLKHPSVSRRHAQLKRSGNHLYVRDLGSQNGTYVNQQRIFQEAEVFAGDSIIIGTSLLKLKDSLHFEAVHAEQPQGKTQSRSSPYYTVLVASLTASFSTLVAMVLLKLIFQTPAPSLDAETTPAQLKPAVVEAPSAPSETAVDDTLPSLEFSHEAPDKAALPPAVQPSSILETFRQGLVENAIRQAIEAKQLLLAEQLTAFLSNWEIAESFWREVSQTNAPSPQALAVHKEALLAAERISAGSSYAQTLQTRIAALTHMPPPPVQAPPPPPVKPPPVAQPAVKPPPVAQPAVKPPPVAQPVAKPPPAAQPVVKPPPAAQPVVKPPKELQEKQRAIDEAFGF